VTLVVRRDTHRPPRDPWAFYDLPPLHGLSIVRARLAGPAPVRRLLYIANAVGRVFAGRTYDVVMTRDLGVADAILRIPGRSRPPVAYESHGFAPEVAAERPGLISGGRKLSGSKRRRLSERERRVWRRADGYITITRHLADELQSRFGSRSNVAVIPDGTRLGRTDAVRPPDSRAPLIGYAGHLYPWKGVDVLLRALADVPDARAIVVGGHPAEPDLGRTRALAARLGVAARVTFTGLLEPGQVSGALQAADVLVLPNTATKISASYTSPLKLFEYLAAAKPVIASDLPAVREILRNEENALLVAPGDPRALAAAIRRLVDEPALAERIARRAGTEAAGFTWDKRAERIEALFERMARRS
jgi:glycosyltransferase involved in cell wall biosynthesis